MAGRRAFVAGTVLVGALLTACASADETASTRPTTTSTSTGSTAPTTAPASPAVTPPPTPSEQVRTITVSIRDGDVDPPPGRVRVAQGETVRLMVTSDVADELHVHGYELEARLNPGKPATIEFTADQTGLFEVETHESEQVLFQLQVE